MRLLTDKNTLDLIPYSDGVILAQLQQQPDGKRKISFKSYNLTDDEFYPVTKGVYLINKFGPAYEKIAEDLDNFILCSAFTADDRRCFVFSPDGVLCIYDHSGTRLFKHKFLYHDCIIRSGVNTGKYFWCTVPKENSLVQFDSSTLKVHLRIGSFDSDTFSSPYIVSGNDEKLCITNAGNGTVCEMELNSYCVKQIKKFNEPIYMYYQISGKEIIWLKSGIYIGDN